MTALSDILEERETIFRLRTEFTRAAQEDELPRNNGISALFDGLDARMSAYTFAGHVGHRIAVEDSLARHRAMGKQPVVRDFVRQETHYAAVNSGWKWNKEKHRFEGMTDADYERLYSRVIGALVRRGCEYFGVEKNSLGYVVMFPRNGSENLRCSLQGYL